jgi:hypothetical protein
MVRKEIGCFITGGWTEAGAMTVFLKKINCNFEYVQCFPKKDKRKDGLDGRLNGCTGKDLINEVYRRIELYKDKYRHFYAIIIEDDLDCRFYNKSDIEIDDYKKHIQQMIWDRLGRTIPIILSAIRNNSMDEY